MEKFPEPTITDLDIDTFITWLGDKENIGKKPIALIIDALTKLKNDRALLAQRLMDRMGDDLDV
jgi:hypothetical protein